MKQKLILTIAVLLLLAACMWFLLSNHSEEDKVRRVIDIAAEFAEKSGEKPPFDEVADFRALERCFAARVRISASRYANGEFPAKELLQRFITGRKFLTSFQVSVHDITVSFDEDTDTAEAFFTLLAQGKSKMSDSFHEAFDCRAAFVRNEKDDWVIRSAEAVPVLSKEPSHAPQETQPLKSSSNL